MTHNEAKKFMDFAITRINNSAWTSEDAATELCKMLNDEERIWKEQEYESSSAFGGRFYL